VGVLVVELAGGGGLGVWWECGRLQSCGWVRNKFAAHLSSDVCSAPTTLHISPLPGQESRAGQEHVGGEPTEPAVRLPAAAAAAAAVEVGPVWM